MAVKPLQQSALEVPAIPGADFILAAGAIVNDAGQVEVGRTVSEPYNDRIFVILDEFLIRFDAEIHQGSHNANAAQSA